MTIEDKINASNKSQIIREKFTISWIEPGIIRIAVHENVHLEFDDVKEIQIHKSELSKNRKHGVLFITPRFGNISRDAKAYLASPEASLNCIAKAAITANLGMRLLVNFFISVNKPPIIHRAFNEEEKGKKWLLEKIKNHV